jgi:hypothetical protein
MGNARILDPSEQCNRLGDGATVSVLVHCALPSCPQGASTQDDIELDEPADEVGPRFHLADHGEVEIHIAWLLANPSPAIEKLVSIATG